MTAAKVTTQHPALSVNAQPVLLTHAYINPNFELQRAAPYFPTENFSTYNTHATLMLLLAYANYSLCAEAIAVIPLKGQINDVVVALEMRWAHGPGPYDRHGGLAHGSCVPGWGTYRVKSCI